MSLVGSAPSRPTSVLNETVTPGRRPASDRARQTGSTMSDLHGTPRTTESKQQVEERSLLGSSYSFNDVGKVSGQSMADLQADDSDD